MSPPERGLEAYTLEGGMKAWNMAWNTAEVSVAGTDARVIQVRRTGKGCLSYLVGSGGEAAVIDASLDPEVYIELAKQRGWKIARVLDTHVHADHLSRSRGLAELVGATLHMPEGYRSPTRSRRSAKVRRSRSAPRGWRPGRTAALWARVW